MLVLKDFVQRHKMILAILLLAAASPSVLMAVPTIVSSVGELPAQARFAVIGFALAICGVAMFASGRWFRRVMFKALQSLEGLAKRRQDAKEKARDWKRTFIEGSSPGCEKVALVELAAGNISNISRESGSVDQDLKAELAEARRKITVEADTAPGVEIDSPPDLRVSGSGEKVAAFRKSPVRDDIGDAKRHVSQWLPEQEPFLRSYLKGCEVQVGIHVVAHGCTSLIDAVHGFAPRNRGTEANAHFMVIESHRQEPFRAFTQNGHKDPAEVPAVLVPAGAPCDEPDDRPILNYGAARAVGRREPQDDRRELRDHLLELEAEFTDMAAMQGNVIFLISNKEGVKENRQIRDIIDVFSSATLRNYHPLGAPSKPLGLDYADLSHVPPGPWIPSVPMSFSDTHAAFGAAREIAKGHWDTPFYGFSPDRTSLSQRGISATFVTGNPRVGQSFIETLDRSLPVHNVVIAHWNQAAHSAWALFCVPATPFEIKSAGLRLDPEAFA